MGLMKTMHTKLCEGTFVSASDKRAGGYTKKSPKSKSKVPPKTDKECIGDMLKGLL